MGHDTKEYNMELLVDYGAVKTKPEDFKTALGFGMNGSRFFSIASVTQLTEKLNSRSCSLSTTFHKVKGLASICSFIPRMPSLITEASW